MKKKPIRGKVVSKLDSIFSQYVRRRYANNDIAECFTCGKQDHWKELQCGHFQSRSHYSTRWDELNCQVQCFGCNIARSGEQFIFGMNLDQKYGSGTSNELFLKAKYLIKLSTDDLEDMIKKYKEKVENLG